MAESKARPHSFDPSFMVKTPEELCTPVSEFSTNSNRSQKINEVSKGKRSRRRGNDWKIMEGLKEGQRCDLKPDMYEGYIMKRRKWPLKGWHKRLFVLDRGILTYAKTPSEIARGKIYGSINIGLSVISTKASRRRIDIDDEEFIYHLRVKKHQSIPNFKFDEWVSHLCHHRLYRQHEIQYGSADAPKITSPIEEPSYTFSPEHAFLKKKLYIRENSASNLMPSYLGRQSTQHGRVAAWILDSNSLEQSNKDLSNIQQSIFNLGTILEKMDSISLPSSEIIDMGDLKKERKKFQLRKNKKKNRNSEVPKSNRLSCVDNLEKSMTASSEDIFTRSAIINQASLESSNEIMDAPKLSSSNPFLSNQDIETDNVETTIVNNRNASNHSCNLPTIQIQDRYQQCSYDFLNGAKEVHLSLRTMLRMIQTERDRLKQALEKEISTSQGTITSPPQSIVASLRASLNQAFQQNAELRAKLSRIHAESDLNDPTGTPPTPGQQNSLSSTAHECNSVLSSSDYFDAPENISQSESSSEGTLSEDDYEEESAASDVSDMESDKTTEAQDVNSVDAICATGRRSKLPAPKPQNGDFSLWDLLCKNIGKDLSKVSMPVTLNEPLNVLQRLCEELEYSDLLDKAAALEDPFERMIYVSAFAVSAYSSSNYRAGYKPFNPLLGETYECNREDRGFKFIAEQVSHHPPVSACYADSDNFKFWQDIRVKTKFWGKSMEIQPLGTVHVILPRWNEHYQWNKVTSCIHNIFSGQRWADQYGEMKISNFDSKISCNLTFVKASYWSNKRHEVHGSIKSNINGQLETKHKLFGKWNEALYCGVPPSARCIWRPGAMPEDYELYYGFSRFAIELNELIPDMVKCLPLTDTRLRPDQRLLEEGDVNGAESTKLLVEQSQRERRKTKKMEAYEPKWFRKKGGNGDAESWQYGNQYWMQRQNPGFSKITFPFKLW